MKRIGVRQAPQPGWGIMQAVLEALLIGFLGAVLFLFVDRYEPNTSIVYVLKFLVLLWGGASVLHRVQPLFGIALF